MTLKIATWVLTIGGLLPAFSLAWLSLYLSRQTPKSEDPYLHPYLERLVVIERFGLSLTFSPNAWAGVAIVVGVVLVLVGVFFQLHVR